MSASTSASHSPSRANTLVDEETPLLAHQKKTVERTPLPWRQLSLILFLQLSEPLTSQVIYPFAPQLIRDIGITHGDEGRVGYYVGLMQSLFFLTQAFTVLQWSRVSDKIGRKPVILTGLFGLSMSMYCFGLSTTFWGLVVSRGLNGLLNGNIGVIKSMVAEITDSTNIAQAYAYMPIAWSTGGTLGPIIGGILSHPAVRWPETFNTKFFLKYPYFLPCAVPATFTLIAWIVTFLFLEETVQSPMALSRMFRFRKNKSTLVLQNVVAGQEPNASAVPTSPDAEPVSLRSLLTPRVVLAAGNYATLALVDIAFRAIQPLFMSTPIELGGLGLPPSDIGKCLSAFGVINGVFQIFFFAKIHDTLGSKYTFLIGIVAAIPVFVGFPLINALARMQGLSPLVWTLVATQIVVSVLLSLSYGAIFIFIAAAAPNRASLGATNGIAQLTVSVMRAVGPAAANSLFSLSIEKNILGGSMVYVVLVGVSLGAVWAGCALPRVIWKN